MTISQLYMRNGSAREGLIALGPRIPSHDVFAA
jgi:hypothetical protein